MTTHANAKAHLQAMQQELQSRLDTLSDNVKQASGADEDKWGDDGSLHERDDEYFAVQLAIKNELNQVNYAIAQCDDGTYGLCVVCQKPIEAPRLEALPFTTLCVEHSHTNDDN